MAIHPSAVVDPQAQLDSSVEVGPFAVIGPEVTIGAGSRIGAHVVISGRTYLGENNVIHSHAAVGCSPQDKKYRGEPTELWIGHGNTIHEFCTISVGTVQDKGITRIGDDNWIMAYVHIAHDCVVGSHTILANNATLAGHVEVDDWVILGGLTAVHQFCKIGAHAMSAGGSIIVQDVPPYVTVAGNHARPATINSEGLKRRGFSSEQIRIIRRAYKTLYREGLPLEEAKQRIAQAAENEPVLQLFPDFFARSQRGVIR